MTLSSLTRRYTKLKVRSIARASANVPVAENIAYDIPSADTARLSILILIHREHLLSAPRERTPMLVPEIPRSNEGILISHASIMVRPESRPSWTQDDSDSHEDSWTDNTLWNAVS